MSSTPPARIEAKKTNWARAAWMAVGVLLIAVVVLGGPVCLWLDYREARASEAWTKRWERVPVTVMGRKKSTEFVLSSLDAGALQTRFSLQVQPRENEGAKPVWVEVDRGSYGKFPKGSTQLFWRHPEVDQNALSWQAPPVFVTSYFVAGFWTFATLIWPLCLLGFCAVVSPRHRSGWGVSVAVGAPLLVLILIGYFHKKDGHSFEARSVHLEPISPVMGPRTSQSQETERSFHAKSHPVETCEAELSALQGEVAEASAAEKEWLAEEIKEKEQRLAYLKRQRELENRR